MVVFDSCFSFSLLNRSLNYERKLQQIKQLHLTLFFFRSYGYSSLKSNEKVTKFELYSKKLI